MKKLIAIGAALTFAIGTMTACGGNDSVPDGASPSSENFQREILSDLEGKVQAQGLSFNATGIDCVEITRDPETGTTTYDCWVEATYGASAALSVRMDKNGKYFWEATHFNPGTQQSTY